MCRTILLLILLQAALTHIFTMDENMATTSTVAKIIVTADSEQILIPTEEAISSIETSDVKADDEDSGNFTVALSGPSYVLYLEDHCPPDSTSINGICKCNIDLCPAPSCDKFLTVVRNGTDNPGNCCPVYTCDNCTLDADNNENCTCGEGAFLNDKGDCECIDLHKSLVDNICQCDETKCELPKLCDNNTIRVEDGKDGCCVKIECRPCPPDTFPTDYQSDEIENKCVCFPCPETQCNETHVPHILRRGTNIPPQCCDLYKCIPKDTLQDTVCVANGRIYTNGQWWITDNKQNCTCNNGVSVCDEPLATDVLVKNCFHNETSYPHLASWTEDACTNCTCYDGAPKCIAHLCNVTVSMVMKYEECLYDGRVYQHLETWLARDCLNCTCDNSLVKCEGYVCNASSIDTNKHCPSMDNCKRSCKNGYKINRRGCEICKCRVLENVVEKHSILEVYMRKHNLSENDAVELLNEKTNRKDESIGTETPPVMTPGQNKGNAALPYIIPLLTFVAGIIVGYLFAIFCKRKCAFNYSPVTKPMDNNNLPHENIKYINEKSPLKT